MNLPSAPTITLPLTGTVTSAVAATTFLAYLSGSGWGIATGPASVGANSFTLPLASSTYTLTAGQTYVFALLPIANVVRFDTTLGSMLVQLRPDAAPNTVANFLKYVKRGAYAGSFIHRSVPSFIVQGGGYTFVNNQVQTIPADAPVANEFKLSNVRGTLAMAKLSNDPNSATTQWFFNESDSNATGTPQLDNQNGGFTVFGALIDSSSYATLDAIAAVPTYNDGSPFDQLPLVNYSGSGNVQASNLVVVNAIVPLTTP